MQQLLPDIPSDEEINKKLEEIERMLSYKELLSGHVLSDVPIAHQQHLEDLLIKVNKLRAEWGKPLVVTSGYRSMQDHLRIYHAKGITDPSKIPMQSKHLSGDACDLSDPDGSLYKWAFENQDKLAEWELWCEKDTKGWLHVQRLPPKSGNRFFVP